MDAGRLAEVRWSSILRKFTDLKFDTPIVLFDQPYSIFRSLCDRVVRRHNHNSADAFSA